MIQRGGVIEGKARARRQDVQVRLERADAERAAAWPA